ncbi:MAG: MFS transporter [Gemmataceae bacterium]
MPSPADRPSRARAVVLALLCSLTFVLYLDRICISQALPRIQAELKLDNDAMKYVLMAFTLSYGLFEVPTGRWGDRLGGRRVLTRIVVWWSAFTALTAACTGFYSLLVVRFLFGAGEAGAYPNVARVVARWYPSPERSRVQGYVQTAAYVGSAFAPVLAAYLIHSIGWRSTFVLFGGLGLVWAVGFWVWFRDDPATHPAVNAAERALIGDGGPVGVSHHEPIPWREAVNNPSVRLLATIMVCASFNSYLYFSWFPKYLQAGRGVGEIEAGWLASLVLAGAAVGTMTGGFLGDWLARGRPISARRRQGAVAYTLAAGLIGVGVLCESPRLMATCAALSCVAAMLPMANWWSCAIEISGRHLGALFGLMNGLGVFGAMGSQYFFGRFTSWREAHGHVGRAQYDPAFAVYVVALLVAAVCWACYVSRAVLPDDEPLTGTRQTAPDSAAG